MSPAPAGAARRERGRPRGPLIYYLLAAFDILTVSASLFLNYRIMSIYVGSVEVNQEWAERMANYAALSRLAAAVDAPGNDVFNSRDVPVESARMQANLVTFDDRLRGLRRELRDRVPSSESEPLLARMAEVDRAMSEMTAEANLIFAL